MKTSAATVTGVFLLLVLISITSAITAEKTGLIAFPAPELVTHQVAELSN